MNKLLDVSAHIDLGQRQTKRFVLFKVREPKTTYILGFNKGKQALFFKINQDTYYKIYSNNLLSVKNFIKLNNITTFDELIEHYSLLQLQVLT